MFRLIFFVTKFLCRKLLQALKMKIIINYKVSSIIMKKSWTFWLGIIFIYHGFIQAIFMSICQHKKLNLHKILFWRFLALKLRWKYFFYFKLFICPLYLKRPKSFRGFVPWTPAKALLWIPCRACSILRASSAFYNIQKLNLSSFKKKTLFHIYIYIYLYIDIYIY